MRALLVVGCSVSVLWAQGRQAGPLPAAQPPRPPAGTAAANDGKPARVWSVQFDSNGYPIVPEEPGGDAGNEPARAVRPAPATSKAPASAPGGETQPRAQQPVEASARPAQPLPSGMDAGSALLDVFQHVRAPGNFKALGGVTVWWRVTMFDQQGAVLGYREITQTADCGLFERDRLEFAEDERICGRSGPSVFAERRGRPWPTDMETSSHDLMLFGMHLRMPWCFGESRLYAITARDFVDRPDERLQRVRLERKPPPGLDTVGPELDPRPRDRFDLLYEPSSGAPRELVHRFAVSGQTRRVLLSDWEEFQGVPIPRRRTYVDDQSRPTTMLQITNLQATQVSERDFRLQ